MPVSCRHWFWVERSGGKTILNCDFLKLYERIHGSFHYLIVLLKLFHKRRNSQLCCTFKVSRILPSLLSNLLLEFSVFHITQRRVDCLSERLIFCVWKSILLKTKLFKGLLSETFKQFVHILHFYIHRDCNLCNSLQLWGENHVGWSRIMYLTVKADLRSFDIVPFLSSFILIIDFEIENWS